MAIIDVPGTLHCFETGNVLAKADEILDTNLNKKQDVINQDLDEGISSLEALSGYYVCDTLGNVNAKTVTATDYKLTVGGSIKIKFEHAQTVTPTSPDTVTLNINNQGAITILYAGDTVTSSNTWDDDEIVNVFYDGTNYLAYSVEGGGLLTTANTSSPNTKKGLTEAAIVSVIGDVRKDNNQYVSLQEQIYAITASSATASVTQRANVGYSTATIRQIITTGTTTDVIPVYGSCSVKANSITLYNRANNVGDWTVATVASGKNNPVTNVSNSDDNFYMTVDASTVKTYNYYVKANVYGTNKDSSGMSVYYVLGPWYYCLFERENSEQAVRNLDATEITTLRANPHGLIITPRGITINLTMPEPTEGYFQYLYFMIPTAPAGGYSTINYLILTSGSYTSTLAMDVVSEVDTSQWSQTGGDVPTGYTIYRTVPINTTGSVNLRTY